MGDVIPFRRNPVIELTQEAQGWSLQVRPCPDGLPSLMMFDDLLTAQVHAIDMQITSGWEIIIHRPDLDGAA